MISRIILVAALMLLCGEIASAQLPPSFEMIKWVILEGGKAGGAVGEAVGKVEAGIPVFDWEEVGKVLMWTLLSPILFGLSIALALWIISKGFNFLLGSFGRMN
jgi:hypothetical protein